MPATASDARPRTEAGRLYVELLQRLLLERRVDSWDDQKEAEFCVKLDELWERMDDAEQDRAERAVAHPANFVF